MSLSFVGTEEAHGCSVSLCMTYRVLWNRRSRLAAHSVRISAQAMTALVLCALHTQVIKLNDDLQPAHYQFFMFQMCKSLHHLHQCECALHSAVLNVNVFSNSY